MSNRRQFVLKSLIGALGLSSSAFSCESTPEADSDNKREFKGPVILTTWNHQETNAIALNVLKENGSVLDAVESAIRKVEADPNDSSVGYGGRPDREGVVSLDACIMNKAGEAGSVCFVRDIMHPITVARMVMEKTPHVILAGQGAKQFALENGMKARNLLTDASINSYKEWLKKSEYKTIINIENHDTIGLLAIDESQDMAGGCSTSGMAYKYHGRVGDSPIIGAGLYVDNEIGSATATGVGEMVLRTLGSFLVVELMRGGLDPYQACKEAVHRIVNKYDCKDTQVGYVALNKYGEAGAYSIHPGFIYTCSTPHKNEVLKSESYFK